MAEHYGPLCLDLAGFVVDLILSCVPWCLLQPPPETHFQALQVVHYNCVFLVIERQYFQKFPLKFGCYNMTRFQALHVVDYNQVI